jgi:Family of unknown function (DUF5681)
MSNRDETYQVGYAKPPRSGRFAKGRSGNPAGRPKGSRNLATIFNKISRERVRVKTETGTKFITKLEAALTQLTNKAASGDLRAIRELFNWLRGFQDENSVSSPSPVSRERDQAVIANILDRMRRADEFHPEDKPKSTAEQIHESET